MQRIIVFSMIFLFGMISAQSQQLMNNIVQFSSNHARETYVTLLKRRDPTVEVEYLDSVFIGAIIKHSNVNAMNSEISSLGRMYAAGNPSIVSYERDQEFRITLEDDYESFDEDDEPEDDLEEPEEPAEEEEEEKQESVQYNAPWHLDRIDQRELPLDHKYNYSMSQPGVNVYVLDTGIRSSHVEFEGRARGAFSVIPRRRAGFDCNGHGTHVAGIVGGKTFGVYKQANIFDVRVLNCRGGGATSGILRAMDWVARNHRKPAVVNMSLGGGFSRAMNRATKALFDAGILPIVAAGNEAVNACRRSPASASEALTIGSTTRTDHRSGFSNVGRCVNMYAPGSAVRSAGLRTRTATKVLSGTSMASPVACGIAAVMLSQNKDLTPRQLKDSVLATSTTNEVTQTIRPFSFYAH